MTRSLAFAAVAAVFVLQAAPAAAAEYKDFREWLAACDNLRNCTAYGFESVVTGSTYLRIERGGAPNAPVKITLAVFAEDDVTFTVRFNDASLPGLPDNAIAGTKGDDDLRRVVLTDTVSADTLIASIRKAEKIIVTRKDPPGKKAPSDPLVSEISMSGAVASLLWIDEQQKRLGTVTALIRKGDKPAAAVPPQPKAAGDCRGQARDRYAARDDGAGADHKRPRLLRRGRRRLEAHGNLAARQQPVSLRFQLSGSERRL